jgi:hypothetical protein
MTPNAAFRTVGSVAIMGDDQVGTRRLTLDIEVGASPITGVVHTESGADQEFLGWTALASVIEAALRTDDTSE